MIDIDRAIALNKAGKVDDAVYLIYKQIDQLMTDKKYHIVDDFLKNTDVNKLDAQLMVSILSISNTGSIYINNGFIETPKNQPKLPHYKDFYKRAKERYQKN
jgi:hypothetical protein